MAEYRSYSARSTVCVTWLSVTTPPMRVANVIPVRIIGTVLRLCRLAATRQTTTPQAAESPVVHHTLRTVPYTAARTIAYPRGTTSAKVVNTALRGTPRLCRVWRSTPHSPMRARSPASPRAMTAPGANGKESSGHNSSTGAKTVVSAATAITAEASANTRAPTVRRHHTGGCFVALRSATGAGDGETVMVGGPITLWERSHNVDHFSRK